MDRELLRLALVNHAVCCGDSVGEAWDTVDAVLAAAAPDEAVKVLADRVREIVVPKITGWASH